MFAIDNYGDFVFDIDTSIHSAYGYDCSGTVVYFNLVFETPSDKVKYATIEMSLDSFILVVSV